MITHKPLLLFVACLLLDSAHSASQYHVQSHLKNTKNRPKLNKPEVADLLQKEVSSVLQYDFTILNIQLQRRPAHQSQHADFDVYIDDEKGPETGNLLRLMENVHVMSVQETDIESTFPPLIPTMDSPVCQNEGFLDNGTCICPETWEGEFCDYLYCFNYGFYDKDKPYQCNCPPGFNDYQCLNRNCRPPIMDDIDPPARTLFVVLPSIIAFQSKRNTILTNFAETVNELQSQEPGWIGYFVGINFVTDKVGGINYNIIQSANITDFVNQMVAQSPLDYQQQEATWDLDLISAIDIAYYFPLAGNPLGNAMVLAFTDTANYYDVDTDYTGWNDLMERLIIWRAKVFFFVIDDVSVGNRTIDTSSPGYDNLRYYSKHIHAPLFHLNETELPMVLNSVASKLYRTQNVDVRLLTNELSIDMPTSMDYRFWSTNNTIKITITLDLLKDQVGIIYLNIDGGEMVQPTSSGKYWQMYELSPTVQSVNITKSGSDFSYSVFQWLSSRDSFLWGIHETSNTDIGGIYTVPEKDNHIGVAPIGTQNVPFSLSYQGRDATTGQIIQTSPAYYTRQLCTLPYEIIGLPQCNTGPYVHYLKSYTQNGDVIRVFPAYCRHALNNIVTTADDAMLRKKYKKSASIQSMFKSSNLDSVQCNKTGLAAFADQRYQHVRQYIFAVEWADNNFNFLEDFVTHINTWINSIYNKNMQQMFTLIVYDIKANNAKTLLSDHYKDHFLQRVNQISMQELKNIANDNFNSSELNSDSLSAVVMANLQTIMPKAVVHVLTQSTPQQRPNPLDLLLPKNIEVNYFYLSDDVGAYPFNIATRQTNGRWFNTNYAASMITNFADESESIELIYDEMYMLAPGTTVNAVLDVEPSANKLEVLVTGVFSSVTLSHPQTNITLMEQHNRDYTYRAVYDVSLVTESGLLMQISCSFCTIQVRVATSLKLYFGFASDMLEDSNVQYAPSAWVRANASSFGETYLLTHVSGLKVNETINTFMVTITQGPMTEPVFTANRAPVTLINMIPRLACGYQYYGRVYSDFLREITYDGLRFKTVVATLTGSVYTRIVYYYIPKELATTNTCNGAVVNQFGECICGSNYTGEYCQNPVCQNGGSSNSGACNCDSDTAGMFCKRLIQNNVAGLTTTTQSTTTNAPSTTQSSKTSTTTVTTIHSTAAIATTTQSPSSTTKILTAKSAATSTVPAASMTTTQQTKTSTPSVSSTVSTRQSPSSTTPSPAATTTKGNGAGPIISTLVLILGVLLMT